MKAVETDYPYLEGILTNLFIAKQRSKEEIKGLAVTVKTLKNSGMSVKEIAQTINRSVGRVYELLR